MNTSLCLLLLLIFTIAASGSQSESFINWASLQNPILQYSNWSIKDDFIQFNPTDKLFYVYFSAFYEDNGQIRSHVALVSTPDFVKYSEPILNFSSQNMGVVGMCSPSVTVWNSTSGPLYYLTFNSWGNDNQPVANQLFYMTSKDMQTWSDIFPLGESVTNKLDVIDSCIAFDGDNGKVILIYKHEHENIDSNIFPLGESIDYVANIPLIATAENMESNFTYLGAPTLLWANGTKSNYAHENYQLIQIDEVWYLLCTDYIDTAETHWPYLYTMTTPGDWLHWSKGYMLNITEQSWNTDNVDNAAAIADWRAYDGYFYLSYAGTTEHTTYIGRGWNRLGLSRSKDLITWYLPGQ